ncbi:uncharacterized protein LOC124455848 [Xenia sp. Carnegie-2017]|uniref:uncharacterized protein LOC124455848 n=1 Tax=Xenia sp. Carnegie-2017 TaxID=2897299 RepID=UPI001F03702B|nr:uncharacterized protein LOC124455848 [Xenia sp. Carnegie-2017]
MEEGGATRIKDDNVQEPCAKKTKPQRTRIYRRKVKCKDCGAEMNADNFLKHSSNKHNGMAKSQDVVEASQTTLHFSKILPTAPVTCEKNKQTKLQHQEGLHQTTSTTEQNRKPAMFVLKKDY